MQPLQQQAEGGGQQAGLAAALGLESLPLVAVGLQHES